MRMTNETLEFGDNKLYHYIADAFASAISMFRNRYVF